MITKIHHKEMGQGLCCDNYKSDIYAINIVYLDGIINSLNIYPTKYPYPNIIVDIDTQNKHHSIALDFSKINTIYENKFEKFSNNVQYAMKFIETELKPFLETII